MTSENTTGSKRRNSVITEKHNSASKKARVSCSSELRFKCSFCSERFPSLLTVRDHTRNEHGRLERLANSWKNTRLNIPKDTNDSKRTPLYRCVACTFASVSYDLMIKHCQHHIIDEALEDVIIKPITTVQMEVNDENIDIDSHTYKELKHKSNMNSFVFVDCYYELLKTDKWPANFEMFNKYEIDKINCSSIYFFTRIIHFTSEEKTSFAPFMLYKCMRCMKYIDSHSVLAHVQGNSCSEQHKGFSCYECQIQFHTESSMYLHYKTHKVSIPDMKYMTITFNYEADKQINTILLKAAGRNMHDSGNNNTLQQTHGTVQPQVGVNSTVQKGAGIAQQQGGINSTVQKGSGIAQQPGGINNTVQKDPGTGKLAGINEPTQQAPAFVHSQVGVKNSQITKDARTMIIQGQNKTNESSEIADANILKDKVVSVYKCQCDLCFQMLDPLFKHIETCNVDLIIKKITCSCSLVFDEQQYELHHNLHSQGVAKFNVKKVIVCDEQVITSNQHKFKENAVTKEDKTKRITKKDIVDTKAKASKNLNEEAEKTIEEIRNNAISQLTTTILNLPSMLTRVSDFKFVINQKQTAVTGTKAVGPKSDDVTDNKSGDSVSTVVTQTVPEANEERNTKYKGTASNIIIQTDNNVVVSEKAVDSDQELAMEENKVINSDSGNTEEKVNQSLIDTTIEVELANTYMTNHQESTKTLESNNQETEAIQNKKFNEFEEIIEEATNEDVLNVSECKLCQKNHINESCKDVGAEIKESEDELLNEDELSNDSPSEYFDANLLTDDEDPILL